MPSPASPARTAGLVAASLALFALAYVVLGMGMAAVGAGLNVPDVVGWALAAGGLVCCVGALRQSLRRWQMTGRPPVAVLLYAALGVACLVVTIAT